MKVDQDAVAGIARKVQRAHEHMAFLGAEADAFGQRQPYRFAQEIHAEGAKHIFRFKLLEPFPLEWGVVIGEAIHDLRSALDHAVYWLSVDHTGLDLDKTQFPVLSKRKDFWKVSTKFPDGAPGGGLYQVRGVGAGPKAFIERLQPYPQRKLRAGRSIRNLHELWNQDKHRLLHLWGFRFGENEATRSGEPRGTAVVRFTPGVLRDNAIAVRILCDPPHPSVKVNAQLLAYVSLQDPKRRRGPVVDLRSMFWDVSNVVARLVGAIGHQATPIEVPPLDERNEWWTDSPE